MSSLLQTKEWADFRSTQGWSFENIDGVFVLSRELFLGKSFLYAPEVNWGQQLQAIPSGTHFYENTREMAKKLNTIFFRLEILDEKNTEIITKLKENGFIKAFEETQPEYRQIIDIGQSEEEIMAQMKEKGRYNIRVAQKHGVVIEKSTNIEDFYQIFLQTAKRDGFEIRPQKYFEKLLEILGQNEFAELLVARYNNKTIAAEIVTYFDETASYLYGASSNEDRQVMAPYLLHWQAMKNAKERGCKYYDLLAVNPEGDENHKFAGIGRFKRQFGGKTVQIVGGYDLVFQPFYYKLFKFAEKIRRH